MLDFRARFRVQSPKGPYVGYGVRDAESGGWLTQVDLPADQAMTVAATLMVAAAPRDVRHADLIRAIVPPRAVRVMSQDGTLAAWAAGSAGWLGLVLVDGEMQAEWVAADKLAQPSVAATD